ncbi:MAG: AAA family ATPase [Blastocatellia bacterium]
MQPQKTLSGRSVPVRQTSNFSNIIASLERQGKVTKRGSEYAARCPAHDDRRASLNLKQSEDGRILMHCKAGCSIEAVTAAIGISLSDLFPPKLTTNGQSSHSEKHSIIASYPYRDEAGKLLFEAVRYEPKDFRQRRPDGKGGWLYSLNGTRRVLYRLPELLAADPQATVFIVEGEKDAEALRSIGLVATCNPMGAGKWRDEYNAHLQGREVVILPDNDESGRKHAEQVAQSLQGSAASVRVLSLPGLPEKGDVSDWLKSGGDAERLCVMVEDAPEWRPENSGAKNRPFSFSWQDLTAMSLQRGEQILYELERGELGIIAAVSNVGKSTLLRNLAITLACGGGFAPLVRPGKARRVMILDFETRLARLQSDIRHMLNNCTQSECEQVARNLHFVCDAFISDEPFSLSHPKHYAYLQAELIEKQIDLLIVDTVAAAFTYRDENSNGEISNHVCKPMLKLAKETGAAILAAHHIGKAKMEEGRTAERVHRMRGASAFAGFASMAVNLTQDAHDFNRVMLELAKVKGQRFDDVTLQLEADTRWFKTLSIEPVKVLTNYDRVIALFSDNEELKAHEVKARLAGIMSQKTIENCLREALQNGDLTLPKRGIYRLSAIPQHPYRDCGIAERHPTH